MRHSSIYTAFLYATPIILLIVDSAICSLLNYHYLSLLIAWYSLELSYERSPTRIMITFGCLCLESLLFYSSLLLPLYYIAPITALVILAKRRVHYYRWMPYVLTLIILLPLTTTPYLGLPYQLPRYTVSAMCVTLIMVYVFSLIYKNYKVNKTIA